MPPQASLLNPEAPPKKSYKMRLLQSEYMVDVGGNNGRFPAGSVVLADEDTAYRWYERGVAEPADPDEETYGEVQRRNKREEFKRMAKAVEGVFDQATTRGSFDGNNRPLMPPPMPTPRGRMAKNRALEGAAINALESDEDE